MLLVFSSTAAAAPPEKVDVIIGFDRPPGLSEQGLVRGFGGEIIYTYNIIPVIAASIPETAVQGLLRNPRVIIEPDVPIHAIDTELYNHRLLILFSRTSGATHCRSGLQKVQFSNKV